jgi:hypothetical protein
VTCDLAIDICDVEILLGLTFSMRRLLVPYAAYAGGFCGVFACTLVSTAWFLTQCDLRPVLWLRTWH